MKKWLFGLMSLLLVLVGGGLALPAFNTFAEDESTMTEETITLTNDNFADSMKKINSSTKINFILNSDIDLMHDEVYTDLTDIFTDLGSTKYFTGTFDGNGYSIKNIKYVSNTNYFGLFPYAKDATIKNLKIEGKVAFDFAGTTGETYAGAIVGYGENVVIENCQLDRIVDDITINGDVEQITYKSLDLDSANNIHFGLLAGKIKGGIRTASEAQPYSSNITNCISLADVTLSTNKTSVANLGGLVGTLEDGFISHCLNFGSLSLKTDEVSSFHRVGGIVGYASGASTKIKNDCFDGNISVALITATEEEQSTIESEYKITKDDNIGNILGGVSSLGKPSQSNINYCYYTNGDLWGAGANFEVGTNVTDKSEINKSLLEDTSMFDPASPKWNFDTMFLSKDGQILLQPFQTFAFSLAQNLDLNGIFNKDESKINEQDKSINNVRYDETVTITLSINDNYQDYYALDGIYLKSSIANNDYTILETKTAGGVVTDYKITFKANAMTEGEYSFGTKMLVHNGFVTISDKAKNDNGVVQGGVMVVGGSNEIESFNLEFSIQNKVKRIQAVPKNKYAFAGWKLYYIDASKNETDEGYYVEQPDALEANQNSRELTITYGAYPFKQNFKLVASFSKDAVTVRLGSLNENQVLSVQINGEDYTDAGVEVAQKSTFNLTIVMQNGYKINDTTFLENLGENVTGQLISEPLTNEDKTTYNFKIDLSGKEFSQGEGFELSFTTTKTNQGNEGNLIWLWVVITIIAVGGIVATVVIIVRRRGGGRRSKGKSSKSTQNKTSYKDYYI